MSFSIVNGSEESFIALGYRKEGRERERERDYFISSFSLGLPFLVSLIHLSSPRHRGHQISFSLPPTVQVRSDHNKTVSSRFPVSFPIFHNSYRVQWQCKEPKINLKSFSHWSEVSVIVLISTIGSYYL